MATTNTNTTSESSLSSDEGALSSPASSVHPPLPTTTKKGAVKRPAVTGPCISCGTKETPLWRRDAAGKALCNACGLYQKSRRMPRPSASASLAAAKATSPPTTQAQERAHTAGTCPGDGRCDGTGGTSACAGCPTWNNSLSSTSNAAKETSSASPTRAEVSAQESEEHSEEQTPEKKKVLPAAPVGALSCANCAAVVTPLWRRDDVGNNICNACGLYFKLHGTHRPITMKKTVIKRRKRVPAAATMSDQAAAEMLVAVGRRFDDSEEEPASVSTTQKRKRSSKKDHHKDAEEDEETDGSSRKRSRTEVELPPINSFIGHGQQQQPHMMQYPPLMPMQYPMQYYPPPIPTVAELEHHYNELYASRRRLEELIQKTDFMLGGVKRGLDSARAASASAGPSGVAQELPKSLPLNVPRGSAEREKVWNVVPAIADTANEDEQA